VRAEYSFGEWKMKLQTVARALARLSGGWEPRLRWRRAGPFVFVLATFIASAPPVEATVVPGLDPGWMAGLHMAAQQHLQWGRDIISTYGPLGYLGSPQLMYRGQWLLSAILAVLMHLLMLALFVRLLRATGTRWWAWVLVAGAITIVFDCIAYGFNAIPPIEYDAVISLVLLTTWAVDATGHREALATPIAAGVLVAFLIMFKGTSVVAAATTLIVLGLTAAASPRRRLLAATIPTAVVATVALWLIGGQSLGNLGAYLGSSLSLLLGYSSAMEVAGPNDAVTIAVVAIALLGVTVAALFDAMRGSARLVVLAGIVSPLFFVYYKEGIVRADVAHQPAALGMLCLLTIVVAIVVGRRSLPRIRVAAAAPVLVAAVAAWYVGPSLVNGGGPLQQLWANLNSYPVAAQMAMSREYSDATEAATKLSLRYSYSLPATYVAVLLRGTVDVEPWEAQLAFAYDLAWSPEPVFQSYQAYGSALDSANASHLDAGSATHVLISNVAIDDRYELFDEPAALRALIEHYHVDPVAKTSPSGWIVLTRNADPVPPKITEMPMIAATWGDSITVPQVSGGFTYARVGVHTTIGGRIGGLIYRNSEAEIELVEESGTVDGPFRLLTESASDGLLVSAAVTDTDSLRHLLDGVVDHHVTGIWLLCPSSCDYSSQVDVTFMTAPGPHVAP
jgi:hypothetical protein